LKGDSNEENSECQARKYLRDEQDVQHSDESDECQQEPDRLKEQQRESDPISLQDDGHPNAQCHLETEQDAPDTHMDVLERRVKLVGIRRDQQEKEEQTQNDQRATEPFDHRRSYGSDMGRHEDKDSAKDECNGEWSHRLPVYPIVADAAFVAGQQDVGVDPDAYSNEEEQAALAQQ
jgi:hypothetical protein